MNLSFFTKMDLTIAFFIDTTKMQKNSGNKKAKRSISGAEAKNNRFFSDILSDFNDQKKRGENPKLEDGIHIAKVKHKLGNGRVEVFFVTRDDNGETRLHDNKQAVIRGSFRGKGKRDVWIDTGSIVVVADTGIGVIEIVGVLTKQKLDDIASHIFVDPRILNEDNVDEAIKFDEEADDEELDVDNI